MSERISVTKAMEWAHGLRKYIRENPDPAWAALMDWDDEMIVDEMMRSGAKNSTQAGKHMSRLIRGHD